ncbi:Uncharacterised protein [Chlamydia trachomatis]|nr:Uncharacterised protein [Chlamydia trachomatis]
MTFLGLTEENISIAFVNDPVSFAFSYNQVLYSTNSKISFNFFISFIRSFFLFKKILYLCSIVESPCSIK